MIDIRNTVALASEWKLDSVPMWILIALAVLTLVLYAVKAAKRGRMRAESVKAESERVEAMREDAPPVKTEETETEIPAETTEPEKKDDGEIIAAITAAISLMLEGEGGAPRGFRVVSFKRSNVRK